MVDDRSGCAAVALVAHLGGAGDRALEAARWRLALSAFSLPDGDVRLVAVVPAAGRLRARAAPRSRWAARARQLAPPGGPGAGGRAGRRSSCSCRPATGAWRALGKGCYATARVSFHRKGRKALHGKIQVRFHAHQAKVKRP